MDGLTPGAKAVTFTSLAFGYLCMCFCFLDVIFIQTHLSPHNRFDMHAVYIVYFDGDINRSRRRGEMVG